MGENGEWPHLSGLLLNGLLPNDSASVIRILDKERWAEAEKRTAELIACIQPNQPSEDRRGAVADYVERLITKCFPCQVVTFGSVPLKTYLPDGDIDVTAFSKNQNLKDTWAIQVRDILESEEQNENAEFRVKEVQYIHAEVKIIKCLVENIVVDISFNQLGGLCTLCFLEEVDNLISQDHLFKRSIILIKAWCYYESRILGAHHGLISTYALETLVLYIFHIFNNSFSGPLEVLYRFLEFFCNFDWKNFCVSLWGPVPVGSLPLINAEPPRKDGGELLLSKVFLQACNSVYAVFPVGLENQDQPFISKYFNVIDPLRINNNLGRSVSKGNFFRIRSAFAYGAKRLARLLDCPKESIAFELDQFFTNTWERHGSGNRPDAPVSELECLRPSSPGSGFDNHLNTSNKKESDNDTSAEPAQSIRPLLSQRASYPESTSNCNDALTSSSMLGHKTTGKSNALTMSDQPEKVNSKVSLQSDRKQKTLKHDQVSNQLQGKHLFARTRSSPELTDAYLDSSSQSRHNRPAESGPNHVASAKMDSSQKKSTMIEKTVSAQSTASSSDNPSSVGHFFSNHMLDASNSYVDDSRIITISQDHVSVIGALGMQQEEQDLVNMMASSTLHNFGGHIPMPLNLASPHLPLPLSQPFLSSMGYGQRSVAGMFPANTPFIDPNWGRNFQFYQGLMSNPLSQFPGNGLPTNAEDVIEHGDESISSVEVLRGTDADYWHERDVASNGRLGPDDVNLEILHADDRQPSTSGSSNFVSLSGTASSKSSLKSHHKEHPNDNVESSIQHQDNRVLESHSDVRVSGGRYSSASQAGSGKSRTSSESSWDGSSARVSKAARDKRGRKAVSSAAAPSKIQAKGKNLPEHVLSEVDEGSGDCSTSVTTESNTIDSQTALLHVSQHPGFEGAELSESDSGIPVSPTVLGPGSRQRGTDNSGAGRFTFYPTGPPVPFFTMLPFYNYPAEADSSEPSSSHMVGDDGPDDGDSGQNFESTERPSAPDVLNAFNQMRTSSTGELSDEPRRDILNSDFASHWENLQFGRLCQSPRYPAQVVSPVAVPPVYLQGCVPWDGPGRPLAANANLLSQLMGYGHHLVPVIPLQSDSSRPTAVYQQYAGELPRYRNGTGTYLPNPKMSARDRQSSSARRNSYNYDRSDHADREGNWNAAKSRAAGRSHNRRQSEKSRVDRFAANDNRGDRTWSAHRHQQLPYQSQNGPLRVNSSHGSSANVAYGMYPLPGMNLGGVASNGPTMQSYVMLYPYDHNSGYLSPGDQPEFGSFGALSYVGPTDAAQPSYEDQRYHRSSTQQSSPDQPSSPHFHRRV